MNRRLFAPASVVLLVITTTACFTAPRLPPRQDLRPVPREPHGWAALREEPELAARILAMDPTDLDAADVEVLSRGPTPWIFTIAPVHPWAWEFLNLVKFLEQMGYPMGRIGDPRSPTYKVYWRADAKMIAGMAASFYEQDGMAPMILGWSGGAIQTMYILHSLSNTTGRHTISVYDPRTGEPDDRDWIVDRYTGERVPVTEIQFSFGGALAAGGLGRWVRGSRWEIDDGLHLVPDSVREFVGFQSPGDYWGSDKPLAAKKKFVSANEFTPMGSAQVRSIIGDESYYHFNVIHCERLPKNRDGRQWIEAYRPDPGYGLRNYLGTTEMELRRKRRNLWCGEMWYAIKKNWAIEAQRVARAVLAESQRHAERVIPEARPEGPRGNDVISTGGVGGSGETDSATGPGRWPPD